MEVVESGVEGPWRHAGERDGGEEVNELGEGRSRAACFGERD